MSIPTLHLGEVIREAFFEFLTHRYPQLVAEYERFYQGKYAPARYRQQVRRVVAAVKARVGLADRRAAPAAERRLAVSKGPVQL